MRNVIIWHWFIKNLVGTRRRKDVDATLLRRIDVVTTSCACWEFGPPLAPQYSKPSYTYAQLHSKEPYLITLPLPWHTIVRNIKMQSIHPSIHLKRLFLYGWKTNQCGEISVHLFWKRKKQPKMPCYKRFIGLHNAFGTPSSKLAGT